MSEVVDLVFPLEGTELRPDYALPLWQALRALAPWLEAEDEAGILPLKGTSPGQGKLILNRRAQLALRLRAGRVAEAAGLGGARLSLGGEVRLGSPAQRELRPTPAQYSPLVLLGSGDETEFLAACTQRLAALGIRAQAVCGRAQALAGEAGELHGFSLMLHGLSREDALCLQSRGMGSGRKLGCGIFQPHKTAHAVGAL